MEDPQKLPQRHDGLSCGLSSQHREAECHLFWSWRPLQSCSVFILSFVFLLLSSIHRYEWGAHHQMRDVNAVLNGCLTSTPCRSVETSDSPESIWNPSRTQHPLESTSGPAIREKPLHHRTLQQSNSWAENQTLRRAARVPLRPGQDARPSLERLEFLCSHPIAASIWSNRRNRGTV